MPHLGLTAAKILPVDVAQSFVIIGLVTCALWSVHEGLLGGFETGRETHVDESCATPAIHSVAEQNTNLLAHGL